MIGIFWWWIMISRYGRTVRPFPSELSASDIPINDGRTDRTSVPVKWFFRMLFLWNHVDYYVSGELAYLRVSFSLTQRRKARKGFYIVNWLHGNRISSWSAETSKRPAWEPLNLFNHVDWLLSLRWISRICAYLFSHARRKGFILSTDIPRDPRDPWRQENAPHGNRWICEIRWLLCLRRISRICAYLFSRKGAKVLYCQQIHELHRYSSWYALFVLVMCGNGIFQKNWVTSWTESNMRVGVWDLELRHCLKLWILLCLEQS